MKNKPRRVRGWRRKLARWINPAAREPEIPPAPVIPAPATGLLQNEGTCPCCDKQTKFVAHHSWYRDHYLCSLCGCIPRERALMYCIELFMPEWRTAVIHESSPGNRGASIKLQNQAPGYVGSQYFPGITPGEVHQGWRCENIEKLSFADASIGLHVTQDVFEHIFDPAAAVREIARTLRPGGMHIFTVPLINKQQPTEVCAKLNPDGTVEHLREPEYHGNPISDKGSLVTHRWGYDICEFIFRSCGLFTEMVYLDMLEHGIRADLIEVLVMRKPPLAASATQ